MRRFLITLTVALLAGAPARATEYVMGVLDEIGLQSTAQGKAIFADIIKTGNENGLLGFTVNLQVYPTLAELQDAIGKNEVQLVYSSSRDAFVHLHRKNRTKPLGTPVYFGKTSVDNCLYVPKSSPVKTVADLRGSQGLTYPDRDLYYALWQHLGERPEGFFKALRVSPNPPSSAIALSLGQTDVAVIGAITMHFLKVTNPGPLKKIRKLACLEPLVAAPVFAVGSMNPKDEKSFIHLLVNGPNEKGMERFRPILDQLGLSFVPGAGVDYAPLLTLYNTAENKGWDKAYGQWIQYALR